MKKISMIVAIAENYVIGKDGKMPWHLPDDLKWFKKNTSGCDVVMGKKTYYSLPSLFQPLPNRKNIILTRSNEVIAGCIMVSSIEEAMYKMDSEKENFIIGGGAIYEQFMPIAQKLYITKVHQSFDGDTYFPVIDLSIWKLTSSEEHPTDEKHAFSFAFQIYERI